MGQVRRTKVESKAQKRKAARACSAKSRPAEITALMNTLRELAAIRSTAEDAAARILDSAEGLLALADKKDAAKVEEAIMSIMTACGFQDLVGQRCTKITETLDRVIAANLGEKTAPQSRGPVPTEPGLDIVLEGPALPGSGQDQTEIDALFSQKA